MTPEERLDSILKEGELLAFPPYGTQRACACFSESTPGHLAYLIGNRHFSPWGIVVTRGQMIENGGGAVAYVPEDVQALFEKEELGHWAVRTGNGSTWLHEREWRVPVRGESSRGFYLEGVRAILIGRLSWRPTEVETGSWVNRSTGEPHPGPSDDPHVEPIKEYPTLWKNSEIWVWNAPKERVDKYAPGTLR